MNIVRLTGFASMCVLSAAVVAYAIVVYGFMPLGAMVDADMRAVLESHRIGIYAHVFASAIALALGPLQFFTRLRNRHISLHRWTGRIYLGMGVLIGGLAGLYMSFHSSGGIVARSGFAFLAIAWLYSGLRAYLAIRAGKVAEHRRWMIRNFALTFAAVTLRLYLPTSMVAGFDSGIAYQAIAWLCWVPNLVASELLFNRPHGARTQQLGDEQAIAAVSRSRAAGRQL